jgi:pimeloyl-ACP methyl ester carboxylesterase
MAEAVGVEAFAAQTELAIGRPDSTPTVHGTRVPMLALGGALDPVCPPPRCTAAGLGPTGTVAMLDGCGHFIPLEAPDAAAAVIGRWMEAI